MHKNFQDQTNRRSFCLKSAAFVSSACISSNSINAQIEKKISPPLGFDNFSIRALGWKAPKLLEYGSSKKINTILFSDLDVYESLEKSYLREISQEAKNLGITIQTGTGGICPTSKSFKRKHGSAEEHLRLLIRVAKDVGSKVARCYLGSMKDRQGEGGIQKHVNTTIEILKKVRTDALDAGIKIAVENHAGDLHSLELVQMIERAGSEYVGATIDSGNATWTLENPIDTLLNLSPHAVSSGVRDSMVWRSEQGVKVQWTAMGDGCTDLKTFASEWKKLCPTVPLQLETISGFTKEFPFKKDDFWLAYPKIKAQGFVNFLKLADKGKEIKPFSAPKNMDKKKAQQKYQLAELEKSLEYAKKVLGFGLR